MNPIIYILFGVFALGLAETLSSKYMKQYAKLTAVGLIIVGSLFTLIYSLILIWINGTEIIIPSWKILAIIGVAGTFSFFGNKLYFTSLKSEEASTSIVIGMASIAVTTILGRIIFTESVAPLQWLGILLIIVSTLFISIGHFDLRQIADLFKITSAKKHALGGALCYGVASSLTKFILVDLQPFQYALIEVLVTVPLYFIYANREMREQINILKSPAIFKALVPVITLYFFYNLMRYFAYNNDLQLPVVDAVDNSVVFVILGLEFLIFKIKQDNYLFKAGVAVIALTGIMLIYIGS